MNILDIHISRAGPIDIAFRTLHLIFHFPVLFRHFLPTHYIHRTTRPAAHVPRQNTSRLVTTREPGIWPPDIASPAKTAK